MPPKIATRSSLENVVILDDMLARQGGATMEQMTDALDCCAKTVRRHINWMERKFGVVVRRYRLPPTEWWVYDGQRVTIFTEHVRQRLR
jgi:predicted ArsR family transcriptional regulator